MFWKIMSNVNNKLYYEYNQIKKIVVILCE